MPASSFVSNPTRTFGSVWRGSLRSTASSVAGFSFAAQPAALAIEVSFGEVLDMILSDRLFGERSLFIVKDALAAVRVTLHVPPRVRKLIAPGCLPHPNVISSRHALGYFAHFSRAGARHSVARKNPPKTALSEADRRVARTDFALRFDNCVPVD